MGDSQVSHGFFYFCLFFGRLSSKRAMEFNHSLFYLWIPFQGDKKIGPSINLLVVHVEEPKNNEK